MKLQFDPHQHYQLDAIRAIVDLFAGQPDASQNDFTIAEGGISSLLLTHTGIANNLVLAREQLLDNCKSVQVRNALPSSDALETMQMSDGSSVADFPNFTVEMETGTGKTYVYLRTIHELHQTYGFKKYVIVVPSLAIREGVRKSLEITKEHFQTLYNSERMEFFVYESTKVNQLRNFALSNAIQILVMNIDAFAKDIAERSGKKVKGNVINQRLETGVRPIEFIQASRPIVILDEPQNLETDIRRQAIARLNPLCVLRYSATHRNTYNLVYKLDPVRAYELGLVKQIGVDSVVELRDANRAYIDVQGFKAGKRSISAKVRIWRNGASGADKKDVTVKNGDDLYALSNQREIYKHGFIVNEMDAEEGYVRFANDVTVRIGQPHGEMTDAILKLQIEATVRRHFEKEKKLRGLGIKVLSVFFIDRVSNYREYHTDGTVGKGKFAEWFEEIYEAYRRKPEFADLFSCSAFEVHNGYFSQDKKTITPFESASYETKADAEASTFALIMRDKERLLDPAEPLRFIFSHSALREGWDNPNVFQICTLAESRSEIRKRQEIGRGMRLCVNKDGERITDRALNRLTIIANESYEDFANQLQSEMEEAGVAFKREMVKNERDKVVIQLRKGYESDPSFLELWQRIQQRTSYRVRYETNDLIAKAAERIRERVPSIERPKIVIMRADISVTGEGIAGTQTGFRTESIEAEYVMPDFVGQVQTKTGLSKSTVAQILLESGRLSDATNNPQAFIDGASHAINAIKREVIVDGVEYKTVDGLVYEMRQFDGDDLMEVFESNLRPVNNKEKTLFSHIVIDSNSGPERRFAEACDQNDDVLFYIKLPKWFQIETPVGFYNPDWALAYKNSRTLYFVAETKDTGSKVGVDLDVLRPIEQLKVECGRRHFKNFEEVQFKVVKSLEELT
ncbi:MAG TPA: DEAD/DEAH box helicase family protein [Pyrinomonadaceae bacterium]|nr:DEAD/DEAH box helicase family protein [Pyrinomonadaceae bacterium]